jgi:hypothetical protein
MDNDENNYFTLKGKVRTQVPRYAVLQENMPHSEPHYA